jgi:hypothetical protein
MGNIPNTNTPNLVLQSVGNGSNDSRWGTSGGGSTLPTGTGTGQMIWWNGTGWVVTVTPTTDNYLYWNGTAWANAVAGDATSIDGYPVNVTGVGNGDVLYWSNVGAVQQWLTGPTPTGDGQLQYWNTSLGGHWSLSAAATATGQALVWNNSTLTWGPANITLAGDVTGSAGANTVVKIQNYPVNMTGVANGDVLYWSNVGAVQQWLTSATPTVTGQVLIWNNTTGSWTAGVPTASGTAGGDLSGTYPNPTVAKVQNYPVNMTGVANGDVLYWSNVGSVQQWVTGPTPTANGQTLIWNSSTTSWNVGIPSASGTAGGDLSGTYPNPTVAKVQGYPVNVTGIGNGDLLYWSNVGTTQWLTGPSPTITGQYYSWNNSTGSWNLATPSGGSAISNQGWTSTSLVTSTLPITSAGKIVEVTGITGFSSYLIGFNITATNGDATTGRNLNAYIYQGSSAVSQQRQYMVNNQTGSTSVSYIASGLTSGTSYSFAGYAFQGGTTTGTVLFATITVLGIA